MIDIRNITVKFGGVVALDNVTLNITDNVVGLIGPNGAGKTTLTNAFSGFVTVHSGSIDIDAKNLTSLPPYKRARWGLARSFQKVQIVDNLTVEDHLSAVLDTKGITKKQHKEVISSVLEFVGLSDHTKQLGKHLNPFQRRMTEIAKCLVSSPKVILLDEPGGGLSESEMQHLSKLIKAIHAQFSAQIILVDHDVGLIREVCTSTAVLDFGKLIAYGPTAEVFQDKAVKTAYLGH